MKNDWDQGGSSPLKHAPRNGCRWNPYEDQDLQQAWQNGTSIATISRNHGRLVSAIESRLCKLFGVSWVNELPRRPSDGRSTNVTFDDLWHTNDGRHLIPKNMELDHLLNSVFDCTFRTSKMRHDALVTLGGTNNMNVSRATYDAYRVVKPEDVFPAYMSLINEATLKFRRVYGLELRDVRKAIYAAWETGSDVPIEMKLAVEFLLNARAKTAVPARFARYMDTFVIDDAKSLRSACWNLRIDQPRLVEAIVGYSGAGLAVSRVTAIPVAVRNRSALNFETPRNGVDELVDWSDDSVYW